MSIAKAIAGLIVPLGAALAAFGLDATWFTPENAAWVTVVLTPFVVWLVPNK